MSGLFLSYSRADRALADQIIRGLRAVGVAVWWDEDMRGVDWQMELEHRISELAGVMVIWSPHSLNSNPVRDEARLALETDKLVNVLSGLTKPPFPYDRINGLPIDGWTGREPHRGWNRLIETVEELVVAKGGARPGDITVSQAMREQEIRVKQEAIAAALEASQTAESRETEAKDIAKAANATATRTEEQLQRVAGMGVTPMILKAAQQEFETARAAQLEAEEARREARAVVDVAARALALSKADLEALFSAVIDPPVLPPRRERPPTPAGRPVVREEPPAELPPEPPPTVAAPPPRPRKAKAAAHVETKPEPPPPALEPAPKSAPQIAAATMPTPVAEPVPLAQPAGAAVAAVVAAPIAVPGGGGQSWLRDQWANPTTRWIAIAGVIGVAALILIGSLARHGAAPAASGGAVASVTATPGAGQPPAVADKDAAALVGAWAMPGFSCHDPVTLAVDGQKLSLTSSGATETGAIQPNTQAGVVRVQFSDGLSSYTLHRNHTLSVVDPSGAAMKMTKCAG